MKKCSRANKGQFSVIAALLVSVILVTAVISSYTLVRHSSMQGTPEVLSAIGEMNADIKSILDFTVGYYGSILQVTGNSTYARGLTNSYLSSGLVNIARSHPEWNPSFTFDFNDDDVSTRWFMPESYSAGNISVTYSLSAIGIEGVTYETSSALTVAMLESELGVARINVTRDNIEPELGLTVENFWFYNYSYTDSMWELVNPTEMIVSNGVYDITLPSGVNQDAYSVQIEDNRGLVVSAFYSQASVDSESGIPHYTYNFDWEGTGVSSIYNSLSTDNFVIEILQNGTLKWLGQTLELSPQGRPIPPVSVKSIRVSANTIDNEIPFQVEDWASDYKVPLGLAGNDSIFSSNNMLVFLVNNSVNEITLWWDGNDTTTQTRFAWDNFYFDDDPEYAPTYGILDNGVLELKVYNKTEDTKDFWVRSTVEDESADCRFLRFNDDHTPDYGADSAYVIYNGIVRDIIQQEPEYGGGGVKNPDCPNFYAQLYLTLPATTTYYTYAVRTIFVDSLRPRTVDDLSVIQLSNLDGFPLTENGTIGIYPETSSYTAPPFFDGPSPGWDYHHWSQFSSLDSGAGFMFTDADNQNLYLFDSIASSETGALVIDDDGGNSIEVNPVELDDVPFTYSLDVSWYGAVVTFDGEPIYTSPEDDHVGLWVMVEHPPAISMDEYEEVPPETGYSFMKQLSNEDSSPDKGSHSDLSAQQSGPDSVFDKVTETSGGGGGLEGFVGNNDGDVDGSEDVGSHSDFSAQQSGPDSVYDTLTEENTAGYANITLLDDGFEGSPWYANWDDESSDWDRESYYMYVNSGSYSARASNYNEGDFTSDSLDTRGASAIYVDFWYRLDNTESSDLQLYVYGDGYDFVASLGGGSEDVWRHYTAKLTESEYFVSDFRILFDANLGYNERVWVDDVVITKETQSSDNYKLDLEVEFTDVVDFLANNELCIYAGALGSEDLRVDYWNGFDWQNLATDLTANSWNNYTVSLSSTTFTVRFSGGIETGDVSVDQWPIDVVLLASGGSGSVESAVVDDASDMDSSSDLGNLVNFDDMKTVDSTYATLSESGSGGGISFVNVAEASSTSGTSVTINKPANTQQNDFMIALLVSTTSSGYGSSMSVAPSGWTLEHDYTQRISSGQHVYIYWKIADASEPSNYAWTWNSYCGWVAQITTFRGVDTTSPIHVEGSVNQEYSSSPLSPSVTTTEDECMVWLYDMCDDNDIPSSGGAPFGTSWIDQTEISNPSNGVGISTAYFVQESAGATGDKSWSLGSYHEENSGQQYALTPASTDYRLDQEVQWTDVQYSLPNEYLSVYGGTMGSEDLAVDVWTGTDWETVFTDLSSGWNNVSISEYLTDSTFTIRFRDGTEVGDASPDTWQIDVALIHVWNEGAGNCEIDLELQWTNLDFHEVNEEL
ncbi:MAG: hypothetical protein CW691_00885, partial [Candidatus Bathyarchaeum sp.]